MPVTRFDRPEGDDRDAVHRRGHGHDHGDDVIAQASELVGWDVVETKIIEANATLHDRVVKRLANPGKLVPAEQVFGPLDE